MPKRINHDNRKEQLLESGLSVLNQGKFTVGKVAEISGISRTTVYNYFNDKDSFVLAISKNINKISNVVEKVKFLVKNFDMPDEVYEQIWENVLKNKEVTTNAQRN